MNKDKRVDIFLRVIGIVGLTGLSVSIGGTIERNFGRPKVQLQQPSDCKDTLVKLGGCAGNYECPHPSQRMKNFPDQDTRMYCECIR